MLWLDTNVVQVLGRQLLKFCKDVNLNVWSGSGFSPARLKRNLKTIIFDHIYLVFVKKEEGTYFKRISNFKSKYSIKRKTTYSSLYYIREPEGFFGFQP